MKDIVTILWFLCVFSITIGVLYFRLLSDSNLEKRLNYYLDINKKYKKLKDSKDKVEMASSRFKKFNEFIRKKLQGELSDENKQSINHILMGAGVNLKPEEYVMLRLFLTVVVGGGLYLITNNMVLLISGAFIGYLYPKAWLNNRRKKRIQKFNKGLPDMINTIIGSLRSGYSLIQALKTVSEDCESPIREEIMILLKELSYGVTVEDALNNLNRRMPSVDLELMIQATLIQRQVGGNLSSILEVIVKTIRERDKIARQVRSLTAQGRLSGKIIGALPIVLGFVLYMLDPQYMNNFLGNIIGKIAISIGVLSGIIGFIIINKITKIEV